MLAPRPGVLVAAAGSGWEVAAVQLLAGGPAGAVLLKRCVDLPDLLASASTGQASVALVSASLPGLDADSVSLLRRAGVAVVVVREPGAEQAALPGVFATLEEGRVAELAALLPAAAASAVYDEPASNGSPRGAVGVSDSDDTELEQASPAVERGTVVAVWGPTGAPGRTTVAVGVAAELAHRGHDVLLVDADGYGGAVAQHLGVLDEVSGLLGAVRAANAGTLDPARLAGLARSVTPGLRVLTGLPRADRWPEVRPAAFDALVETARALCGYVVLDLGFNLEQEAQVYGSGSPQRNHMTVAGLELADEVLVVGSADPVGLARLARGLVELRDAVPVGPPRVVVNRVRPSLGWAEQDVRRMVEGFVMPASLDFLPDDPSAADRALVSGRTLRETGDSALASAMGRLAAALDGTGPVPARAGGLLRRRRAGRAR